MNWEEDIKKTDVVLDVGCWSGKKVQRLLKKCDAYGIDINKDLLSQAPEEIKNRLFYADITKGFKTDKKFDWIFLEEVLEHLEKDNGALRNINKLLKKGGKLVITTPKEVFPFDFYDPAYIKWHLGGDIHYHYEKKELFDKLEENGFKIIDYRVTGDFKWLLSRWVNVFLKHIILTDKRMEAEKNLGYFDWEILAEKC